MKFFLEYDLINNFEFYHHIIFLSKILKYLRTKGQ